MILEKNDAQSAMKEIRKEPIPSLGNGYSNLVTSLHGDDVQDRSVH